ncbi:hypothetical protein ACLOJK_014756, partial [Asimina triloba]
VGAPPEHQNPVLHLLQGTVVQPNSGKGPIGRLDPSKRTVPTSSSQIWLASTKGAAISLDGDESDPDREQQGPPANGSTDPSRRQATSASLEMIEGNSMGFRPNMRTLIFSSPTGRSTFKQQFMIRQRPFQQLTQSSRGKKSARRSDPQRPTQIGQSRPLQITRQQGGAAMGESRKIGHSQLIRPAHPIRISPQAIISTISRSDDRRRSTHE